MPASAPRLAIDLSGGLLRVLEGALGGPIRCGAGGTPAGSFVAGKIADSQGVASALRQLLARTEIQESHALVAISDSLATFRVLTFPASATDMAIDSAVAKQFPIDPERMATRWVDIHKNSAERSVFATAWDRSTVKVVTDTLKLAGLDAVVVDLKSACVARAVAAPSCIVVDVSSSPVDIFLIDDHVPQVWQGQDVDLSPSADLAAGLAGPIRSVLRYYKRRRDTQFGPASPIFIAGDQTVSMGALTSLGETLGHPVKVLPLPPRVPHEVRHGTYLTCLGLIMRRTT